MPQQQDAKWSLLLARLRARYANLHAADPDPNPNPEPEPRGELLCCCGRSMAKRGRTTTTTTTARPAAHLLASWLGHGGWRMATRPTGHPDRYLATGKKYVVSTSNRVVINLKCGAPTKIRQGKLVARILTHAQKEKRSSALSN